MPSFSDYAAAAQMRDLVGRLVETTVERFRPRYRYATVVSIDRAARKCEVQYQGEPGTVMVNMGSVQPLTTGQVVRIDGLLGDRFISDVMGPVVNNYPAAMTEAEILALPYHHDGQQFFVTDKITVAWWYDDHLEYAPWNTPWGLMASQTISTDSAYTATGNSDMVLLNFPCRADRNYNIHFNSNFVLSGTALWGLSFRADGAEIGRGPVFMQAYSLGIFFSTQVLWQPSADGTPDIRIHHTEHTGTATLTYSATAGLPRQLWIDDVGPRVRTD